jgi:dihydroorotase
MAVVEIYGKLYGAGEVVRVKMDSEQNVITDISAVYPDDARPDDTSGLSAKEFERYSKYVILPGLVDLHTHLREPGSERSETIATGSRAAAAGGFTCVHAMANTIPTSDTASAVEQTWRIGREVGLVDVRPIGAVTRGLEGVKLASLASMNESNAKVTVFSDDGKCVHDPLLMRRALEYVKKFGGVVAQHAQDPRLTENAQMNEGKVSAAIGLAGWPGVAEESIIARDILLAQLTKSRLHICHLSTRNSVEIVRFAKSKGIQVTAEVTPHHLTLTQEELREYNPRYKVNPPLRTLDDVEALRIGVQDGTIDIVATDHAPHALEMKYCNFQDSAFGMTGLETALQAVHLSLVETGMISWRDVARIMSETPARIGGVIDQGQELKVGSSANICVYDASAPSREVVPEDQFTKSTNSPYKHKSLPGEVVATYFKGRKTH